MNTQTQKAETFKALHKTGHFFLLPNPWDIGSSKILSGSGFPALATTSAGCASALGKSDYEITREDAIHHARMICAATDLPVTADLENGFGDTPQDCAETIRLGAEAGLVGASIEDFTRKPDQPQYELSLAKERITAAVEAARALPFDFTLTARAENFFTGIPDLKDTIKRLQAYQEAGADVLYAPGLTTLDDIKNVLSSIDKPLNVLLGPMSECVNMNTLKELGVARVSFGPVLLNAAYGALIEAANEITQQGTLSFLERATSSDTLNAYF